MEDIQVVEKPVGEMLRNRRQLAGMSIEEVSKQTRIRKIFLEAMEEERFEIFSGEAYLIGFLRLYAQALGLDPAVVLEGYRNQAATDAKVGKSQPKTFVRRSPPSRKHRRGLIVFLVTFGVFTLVALLVAFYGWLQTGPVGHPLVKTPQIPIHGAKNGEPAVPSSAIVSQPQEVPRSIESGPGIARVAPTEWPNIPVNGAVVRLEAYATGSVLATVDDRQPRRYDLVQGAALNWPVHSKFHIIIEHPGVVALWLGGQPLDIGSNLEVQLMAVDGPLQGAD